MGTKLGTEPVGYVRRRGAARYLSIAERTVSDWQRRRIIPAYHLGRRAVLFRLADLDAAMLRFRSAAVGDNDRASGGGGR